MQTLVERKKEKKRGRNLGCFTWSDLRLRELPTFKITDLVAMGNSLAFFLLLIPFLRFKYKHIFFFYKSCRNLFPFFLAVEGGRQQPLKEGGGLQNAAEILRERNW